MEIISCTKISLIDRGISVALPVGSRAGLVVDPETRFPLPQSNDLELARLATIADNSVLRQRYPTPETGLAFMRRVAPNWRKYLLEEAFGVAQSLADICSSIGRQRVAVLIFGSLSRDLVKRPCDIDPSNIDISVVGEDIQPEDRETILNAIRPERETKTTKVKQMEIINSCQGSCGDDLQESCRFTSNMVTANSSNPLIERVGIHVQPESKIRRNQYSTTRVFYIGSCAIAAYDPTGFWRQVEEAALQTVAIKRDWVHRQISSIRVMTV